MNWLDDPVFVMWVLATGLFGFLGTFALGVWIEVKGIRGIAMVALAYCLMVLCMVMSAIRAGHAALIPRDILTLIIRAVFPIMLLSVAVIIDLWAADHNDHRSLTTRSYLWFKRLVAQEKPSTRRLRLEHSHEQRQTP